MWPFRRKEKEPRAIPVFLTNTLSGRKEVFVPLRPGHASVYSCGPTVYSRQHIGNMRAAVFADTLGRVLAQAGYHVRRVINITDVGHLTGDNEGDANQGEDRMEKSARESGSTAREIAERYAQLYMDDIRALGVDTSATLFPHATQYIPEQIALIEALEKGGHTYRIADGIYFDTSTFPGYGKLGSIPHDLIKSGDAASVEDRIALAGRARIAPNAQKRNPEDFALWKFSPAGVRRQQEWQSPWGRGFPGWHVECSAMSKALLGSAIDIHTGGIEHIPVHHNNEIAQTESVTHKPYARYWLHLAHLTLGAEKIAKSTGNALYVSDVTERGFHPLALRYFFLQAGYRSPLSFSWEALAASAEALSRLWRLCRQIKDESKGVAAHSPALERFLALVRDDLATPKALAFLWETLKDEDLSPRTVWGVVCQAERVFGLALTNPPAAVSAPVPEDVVRLVREREAARAARDFSRADELRIHIEDRGYAVDDTPDGPLARKK